MREINLDTVGVVDISSDNLTTLRSNIIISPSLAPAIGAKYKLTDGILQDHIVEWNGEAFSSTGPTITIVSRNGIGVPAGTRVSVNNATDADFATLAQEVIPGFLLGPNSTLTIHNRWQGDTSANKRLSNLLVQGGLENVLPEFPLSGTNLSARFFNEFTNNGVHNQQIVLPTTNFAQNASNYIVNNINTRQNFTVRFRCRWDAATMPTSTILLRGYTIELKP